MQIPLYNTPFFSDEGLSSCLQDSSSAIFIKVAVTGGLCVVIVPWVDVNHDSIIKNVLNSARLRYNHKLNRQRYRCFRVVHQLNRQYPRLQIAENQEYIMRVERPNPYIWVSWITKLMAGENQCEWASWFRSHYKWDKLPSDFDLAKWTAEHTEMLHRRRDKLEAEGFTVYIEDQNSFKLTGKTGIEVSGKPDIVAIKGSEAYVEDCKTGTPRNSDHVQVLVYMLALPLATNHCKGLSLEGRIVYKNATVDVPSSKIDTELRELFKKTVLAIGGSEPARRVPSWGECRFCDISRADCPERIDTEPAATAEDHDLF